MPDLLPKARIRGNEECVRETFLDEVVPMAPNASKVKSKRYHESKQKENGSRYGG